MESLFTPAHVSGFGGSFRQIHFVDFAMKRSTADAELFGHGGHVVIRGCKRLGNQLFPSPADRTASFFPRPQGTETPLGNFALATFRTVVALLNVAMADAAVCAWDAKYAFHFWRPVTAIAFAEPELNWMSFIVTPPFPDYISGHSTFSGAAATVVALFYGTEDLPFTIGSDFLPGVYRSFSTCLAAAEEAAISRLYGGIHFRSAKEDGLQAGISVGEWTATHYLQPKGNRSR